MDVTIHQAFLPHDGPDASPAPYRHTPRFEVPDDVGYAGMRRVMAGRLVATRGTPRA